MPIRSKMSNRVKRFAFFLKRYFKKSKHTHIHGKWKTKMQIYKTIIQKGIKWQGLAEDRIVLSSST